MPFRFPLASVLRYRESLEKREEAALQKAQLEVARIRRGIEELTAEIARKCHNRDQEARQSVQANRLQLLQFEIDTTMQMRTILQQKLEISIRQRDKQMKLYRKAYSDRHILTELLEQKKTIYEQEQEKQQQKRLDDLVASRWQRG